MDEVLGGKRGEILGYLAGRAGGVPPSVREVAEAVGLRSSQTAHYHLGRLAEGGYVAREGRGARGLRLTEKGWAASGRVELLGRVAAGRGLEAVASGDEAFSLVAELLPTGRAGRRRYLLTVVGQSMVGAGIEDGDLLVVEEDEAPADGEVVVALLRGGEEVTVKRLFREGEVVRLRPENGEHEDIVVPATDLVVQGRVVFVVHPPRRVSGRAAGGGA